jgi:hypothetical protein
MVLIYLFEKDLLNTYYVPGLFCCCRYSKREMGLGFLKFMIQYVKYINMQSTHMKSWHERVTLSTEHIKSKNRQACLRASEPWQGTQGNLACHSLESGFYSGCGRKSLEGVEKGKDIICFMFSKLILTAVQHGKFRDY